MTHKLSLKLKWIKDMWHSFDYKIEKLNISLTCDSRNKTLSEGSRFKSVCLGIAASSSSNNSCQGTAAEALQLAKGPLLGPGSSEERKSFVVSRLVGTPVAASNGVPRRSDWAQTLCRFVYWFIFFLFDFCRKETVRCVALGADIPALYYNDPWLWKTN